VADLPSGVGLFVKALRDSSGRPVLVYHDGAAGVLKRAMMVGPDSWSVKVLDPNPIVGHFPSATIDQSDILHVAYTDVSRGRLLYLSTQLADSVQPEIRVVDTGIEGGIKGRVGAETQLVLDAQGTVHILYQDQRRVRLMHATKAAQGTEFTIAPLRENEKAGYGFFTRVVRTQQGFLFVDYRYDRGDTPTSEITTPEEATRPLPHGVTSRGVTFGWLEVGTF